MKRTIDQLVASFASALDDSTIKPKLRHLVFTEGGLVEFDPDGKLKRRYTILDGLPESDLTCLIPFSSKLFIGTRSQGMVVFDGKRFESYLWPDRNVEAITVLLEGGELFRLVADAHSASRFQLVSLTWNRPEALSFCRLIESDQKIGPQSLPHPGNQKGRALWLLSSEGIWRISRQDERFSGGISFSSFGKTGSEIGRQTVNHNAMTNDGERLYAGTLNGAWILDLRSQKWVQLKSELPSSVVLSVTSDNGHVYLGTTSGIARLEKDYLKSVK